MSFTRAHYELYIYHLRNLDHNTTQSIQLCSIERSMYAYWTMLLLDHPVRYFHRPIRRRSSAVFLPSDHPYLTSVRKDGLWPSHDHPTTVGSIHLRSYLVVQVMDYKWNHFFFYVSGSSTFPSVPISLSSVPYPHPAEFILFIHVGEAVVCTTCCSVIDDGRRYYLQGSIPCWKP